MERGVLGGSFDPPHIAHVMLSLYVLETTALERLLWIPCGSHPLGKNLAPFAQRMELCRLATRALGERVEVLEIENELPQPNYTVDTLRALAARYPDDRLRLVVGGDIMLEREQWREFEEVERLAPLLVVPRRGFADAPDEACPLPDVRSHLIRGRLERGENVERLLPRGVLEYIQRHALYR